LAANSHTYSDKRNQNLPFFITVVYYEYNIQFMLLNLFQGFTR
jgi:hypothetical protein